MITVTAMKWVPPFAAGRVCDHRARWILNEAGWPYEVRLVDMPTLASGAYRALQPFGQVPVLEEKVRPAVFKNGTIVLDVATKARILSADTLEQAQGLAWRAGPSAGMEVSHPADPVAQP